MECQSLYPETDLYPRSSLYDSSLWEPHRMRAASEMVRQRNRASSMSASIPRSYSSVDTESFASPLSFCNPGPSTALSSTALSSPASSAQDLVAPASQDPVDAAAKKPSQSLQSSLSSGLQPLSQPTLQPTLQPSLPSSGSRSLQSSAHSVSQSSSHSASQSSAPSLPQAGKPSGSQSGSQSGVRAPAGGRARGRSNSLTSGASGGHTRKRASGEGEDVNIDRLRSGEDRRTCVMLRNLPNRYHMENLHNMLFEAVGDHYNIVSLPLDVDTRRNLGYCFVKFSSVEDLIRAYEHVALRTGGEV